MPVNHYECLVLLDSGKVSTNFEAAREQLHAVVTKYGAEILASRPWNESSKLAYPIKGQKRGLYYLMYFKAPSLSIMEIEQDFRLSENILRHIVIAIDAKWEEEMFAVARDENRMALIGVREDAMDMAMGPSDDDRRRRRNDDSKP